MTAGSAGPEKFLRTQAATSCQGENGPVHATPMHAGEKLPWRSNARRPEIRNKEDFLAALEAVAARCSGRKPIDNHKSADELIGYDDFGLPR